MHRGSLRALAPLLTVTLFLPARLAGQERHALGIDEYITTPIVGDPQLSPDGGLVAFTVSVPSLEDNRSAVRIWLADIQTGETRQATNGPGSDWAPRWSPDGKTLTFLSTRDSSVQFWKLPRRGGEPTRIGGLDGGVSDYVWSPDGKALYYWKDIPWGDSTEAARRSAPYGTKARIWTDLFYRHWDEWRLGVRSHVFRFDLADTASTDVTPFDRDVPPLALGGRDVALSPVGTELAVVYNPDSSLATSTNNDIFVMGPDGSSPQAITGNDGNDHSPQYSPDGRQIAYLSMATAGFEADRQQIMLYERASGRRVALTPQWQLSVAEFRWLPDSRAIMAEVEDRGEHVFYRIEVPSGRRTRILGGGTNTGLQISGEHMVFLRQTASHPPEVFTATIEGRDLRQLSHVDDERVAALDLNPAERFGFVGAQGDSVFGWLVRPPGFRSKQRYPLVYLIHGGPQGSWLDQWHARWNYAMFAARGYVVAAVDFHGSTGYGQPFTNSISRNWGGPPFEDLMKGLDVVARLPYVDSTRMGAAGASYGGYMIYWLAGHTSRFKTLVAHDGIFNPLSMTGTTEELWFPLWEFGGSPLAPVARVIMEKWSPANYIQNWSTPMLIVHSQNDFRVDLSEGLQAFTALRLRKIPGKFLYFPDEGHFVLKPQNRRLWWSTVLDWLDQYLHPER